jgi:hypothetical protein
MIKRPDSGVRLQITLRPRVFSMPFSAGRAAILVVREIARRLQR